MHRALLPVGVCGFLLAASALAAAAPGSASATFTVSVEVVRSCTVQTDGGGSIDCHGQTPSTLRMSSSPSPAPPAATSTDASTPQSQVVTVLF